MTYGRIDQKVMIVIDSKSLSMMSSENRFTLFGIML